ncbi:MAG: D-alanine--D-alanine ligase family protein [bacterium]
MKKDYILETIWVISGGPTTEFDVSLSSARVVCERINSKDRRVRPVIITRSGRWIICDQEIREESGREWLSAFFDKAKNARPQDGADIGGAVSAILRGAADCMFLALHGQFGEDGRIQGFLETVGIPYTGSGVLASALAFNKAMTIDLYKRVGLPTARSVCVGDAREAAKRAKTLNYPVFIKPVKGGSSVGMSLVNDHSQIETAVALALETDTMALIEERISGVEVSCGVLDVVRDGKAVSLVLPPTEIRPVDTAYFDYEAKYVPGRCHEITPAELPPRIIDRIREYALRAHQALGCEGMSRTDMILHPGNTDEPVVLETNTIPGMTPTSLLPQQAAAAGINFPNFLDILIAHAMWLGARA